MKIDVSRSIYHEDPEARREFSKQEIRGLRVLLRRLRFLEHQIRETGGLENGAASGGAAWAEWEVDALEFVLTDIGFLAENDRQLEGTGR